MAHSHLTVEASLAFLHLKCHKGSTRGSLLSACMTSAGGWAWFNPYYNKLHAALLAAAVLDAVIAYVTPPTVPRVGSFLRICLLANRSSDIRQELWMILRIIPGLSSVLVLTLMTLAFFSFFGLVLFHETAPHYFGNFWRAMWQLWVLMTTSNFPDVRTYLAVCDHPMLDNVNIGSGAACIMFVLVMHGPFSVVLELGCVAQLMQLQR